MGLWGEKWENFFFLEAGEGAEFVDGYELVGGFVEGFADSGDEVAGVAFAAAGYDHDIFGVYGDAREGPGVVFIGKVFFCGVHGVFDFYVIYIISALYVCYICSIHTVGMPDPRLIHT